MTFSVLTSCSSESIVNFYRLFTPSSHLGPFKWYQSQGHRLIEGLTTSVSEMVQVVFNHVWANHHSLMAHAMIIGRER
jgi:hypothetical protein